MEALARGYLYETSSGASEPADTAIARAMYRSGDERLLSPLFRPEVACSYGWLAIDRELDPRYLLRVNLSAAGRAHEAEHGTDCDDACREPTAAAPICWT